MSDDETTQVKKRPHESDDEEEPANAKKPSSVSADDQQDDKNDDTKWDVTECRGDHESVEHWELRKHFLEENMGRFTKSRLICLSQVFANVEFLGCRYPEATMELVQDLSLGIVESYREKQKTRLQRTFVKASDAAERKTKGVSTIRSEATCDFNKVDSSRTLSKAQLSTESSSSCGKDGTTNSPFQKIILMIYLYNTGENSIQIVHRSCESAHVPLNYDVIQTNDGIYKSIYQIGQVLTVESNGEFTSKDQSKQDAAKRTFLELQKHCYIFVTKLKIMPDVEEGKEVLKNEVILAPSVEPTISENNIGNKLLKLMGWTGGGLGKNNQGIHEAISVNGVVGRSRLGLGSTSTTSGFLAKIKRLLKGQKKVGFTHDLKFSSDFSKDERKIIHMIAKGIGLKSKSYGKDDGRYIVVSEKISRQDLMKNTLQEGGETDKYRVIPPGGSIHGLEEFI